MDAGPSPLSFLLFFLLLVLGGAYFAGSETALSSVNRIRMMSYADDGSRRAKKVLLILDSFDEALSAILIGNNIMHIGSASLATLTATRLWGAGAVGVTTVVTALVVFLFAEMLPKTVARACSERFALFCAPSLLFIMRVLKPFIAFFTGLSARLKRFVGIREAEEPTVTEEELHEIIGTIGEEGEAEEDGAVDEDTAELLQSALDFTETPVKDVYTPWDAIVTVRLGEPPAAVKDKILASTHSRLPVLDQDGRIAGMLQIRRYLKEYLKRGGHVSLKRVMDPPFFVKTGLPIDELLGTMSRNRVHAAVVQGEGGKPLGLITVEDILEELVGEIDDEEDTAL